MNGNGSYLRMSDVLLKITALLMVKSVDTLSSGVYRAGNGKSRQKIHGRILSDYASNTY